MTTSDRVVLQSLLGDFRPSDHGDFIPFFPGVEILPLYGLDAAGHPLNPVRPSAALLRYAPGAAVPPHRHRGYEHILVLSGAQEDDQGTYQPGTLVISPPGTEHAVASAQGCLVLAIWAQSVEVIHD